MNALRDYKGYTGALRIDSEANVLRGKVINTLDTITFQGRTVEEAVAAFRDSVDDYLEFCDSLGRKPDKPFTGKFLVRVKPDLHRVLSTAAQAKGVSFNKLVSQALAKEARRFAARRSNGPLPKKRKRETPQATATPVEAKPQRKPPSRRRIRFVDEDPKA